MEYRGRITTKIIRTEHQVSISQGGSAANLKQALSPVPINAKLVEMREDRSCGAMVLIFMDECADDVPPGDGGKV
jgi:hypothetical protein